MNGKINAYRRQDYQERKYLPLEIRKMLYKDVRRLAGKGLGSRRIRTIILRKYGKMIPEIQQLSRSTIQSWMRNRHKPDGRVTKLKKKSPALQYIIGAFLSDGSQYRQQECGMYRFDFRVRDLEFAQEVSKNLREVGIKVSPKIYYKREKRFYNISFSSYELYTIIRDKGRWKSVVAKSPIGFIRGFFDGDGGALMPYFSLSDRELLRYLRQLLVKEFNIACSPIFPIPPSRDSTIDGHIIKPSKPHYRFLIHPKDYEKFYQLVNTPIRRKKHLLKLSIEIAKGKTFLKMLSKYNDKWWEYVERVRSGIAKTLARKRKKKQ